MKVEQASSPQSSKSTTGVTPKVSMFGAKFGFVIPKNKLSGSLVPAFRGASKSGNIDPVKDENKEQVVRKTKWGPDLTQDAFVRKSRLLAYQTRVNQITQLIETKDQEAEVGRDADMESLNMNNESPPRHTINAEELENLKLEKREIIGEILKLNPNYKTPPDYIPLLKEARVPLPIKDYPGYNFLGLIYGSGSDTLKRLEKETGAKIQVFGNKIDSADKVEITSEDKKKQDDYMELYVLVSADTYDKVDAAVALVELLVTPVSASAPTVSGSNTPILSQSSEAVSGVPNTAGGVVQPLVRPTQIFQDQFQYISPAPASSNPARLISSQTTSEGMAPAVSAPSPFPSVQQQHTQFPMQHSHTFGQGEPPRYPMVAPQTFPSQSNLSNAHQFSGSQHIPMGMSSLIRSVGPSWPQSGTDNPIRSQLNQDGSSIRWPGPPVPTPNIRMMGNTGVPAQGQQNTAIGMAPSFQSRPSSFLLPGSMNQGAVTNTFVAPTQVRPHSALPQGPSAATIPTHPMPNLGMQTPLLRMPIDAPPQNSTYRPGAAPFPRPSAGQSASVPPLQQSSFHPARPAIDMVPRMQFPNPGDFVFQSQHQHQNSAALMNPWHGSGLQNNPPLRPTMQKPLDFRAPSFQPDFPNRPQRPFFHSDFRPHADEQFDRFQPHFTDQFPVFSHPTFRPFQHDNFGMLNAPLSHMEEMARFRPMANMHGSFPSRPGNDYFPASAPDRNPFNRNPATRQSFRPSGGQQAYDPFSPTTASTEHQQPQVSPARGPNVTNTENKNPENEDTVTSADAN